MSMFDQLTNPMVTRPVYVRKESGPKPKRPIPTRQGRKCQPPTNQWGLSPTECEIMQLTVEGLSPDEISERMFKAPKTVHTHLERARKKMGARRMTDAVLMWDRAMWWHYDEELSEVAKAANRALLLNLGRVLAEAA